MSIENNFTKNMIPLWWPLAGSVALQIRCSLVSKRWHTPPPPWSTDSRGGLAYALSCQPGWWTALHRSWRQRRRWTARSPPGSSCHILGPTGKRQTDSKCTAECYAIQSFLEFAYTHAVWIAMLQFTSSHRIPHAAANQTPEMRNHTHTMFDFVAAYRITHAAIRV